MDVLKYTEEELKSLNKNQLNDLLIECENKETFYNTRQLVEKTLMNSLYGALANKYFLLFNESMAGAITGNGRYFIRKLANYIEEKLQSLYPSDNPYIIAGDTDSCVGSTLIETNQGKVKIKDLYDYLTGVIEIKSENNFIKHNITPIKALSVSSNKNLEYQPIKYIMKHKVKKRIFKIKCQDDEVQITEDHSIVIMRNNQLVSVKPNEIKKGDKIICI